jgi:16S rRNA (cytosine1402-N4)-methyltransferase
MPVLQVKIDAAKAMKPIGKAIKPSAAEIQQNVRSRSSVLRVAEKL